jgi:hypothetical protein
MTAVCIKRIGFVAVALTLGGWASAVSAAPSAWDDLVKSLGGPRDGELIFEHLPTRYGGLASDTDFLDLYQNPKWQQLADDVLLGSEALVERITVWGFYDQDNPPSSEVMRLRFYAPRESDGLPGNVLYEESFANPSRTATGYRVGVGVDPHEYLYDVTLATPFTLAANTLYWLEFVQVGDQSTAFRWEDGRTVAGDHVAVANVYYPNWYLSPARRNTAFQLWAIPEPSSLALLTLGLILVRKSRSRKED